MDKNFLRLLYKKKRAWVDSLKIEDLSIQIANQILILPIWGFENFHVFMGVEKLKEINTNHIISVLTLYGWQLGFKNNQLLLIKVIPYIRS